jgi:hypothetical protein
MGIANRIFWVFLPSVNFFFFVIFSLFQDFCKACIKIQLLYLS